MLACVSTAAISGIEAKPVEIEVEVRFGLNQVSLIGLGDTAVKESKERVISAIRSSGFQVPEGKVLISLAPAELKKEGSSFDLPIALGMLAASEQIPQGALKALSVHGELALDGRVKGVNGAIAMVICAAKNGARKVIIPEENIVEGSLISGVEVVPVASLSELIFHLRGGAIKARCNATLDFAPPQVPEMADVWGQESAKRALLLSACGAHNLLMIGPPGCGKSLLASTLPGILPRLTRDEQLDVLRIHSISGLPLGDLLRGVRPIRAPHHGVSDVGLIGGGSVPRPGEITLAHRGVLFLDELPEFRRTALEALRTPLESGYVHVSRANGRFKYPSSIQLVAAMNPCPCGKQGIVGINCLCSPLNVRNYLSKISQPILDRIDLHVEVEAVPLSKMGAKSSGPNNAALHEVVGRVRERQLSRSGKLNCQLTSKEVLRPSNLNAQSLALLDRCASEIGLSARSFVRILRVARTIADLAESKNVEVEHVGEAIGFRNLERKKRYYEKAA